MTHYRFHCLGPYPFKAKPDESGTRRLNWIEARNQVFDAAAARAENRGVPDLTSAIGLYVLALKPSGSRKAVPYYVGRASSQTLYKRLFQAQDKVAKYESIMAFYQRATPYIYLFPLVTEAGHQVQPTVRGTRVFKVIENAEQMLITQAARVNPWLYNLQHVVAQQSFSIDGTPQRGLNEHSDARSFREMMGYLTRPKPTNLGEQISEDLFREEIEEDA